MKQPANKVLRVRVTEEAHERITAHAAQSPFDGNESQFVRWATEVVMGVMDAHGPQFWQVIADVTEPKAEAA